MIEITFGTVTDQSGSGHCIVHIPVLEDEEEGGGMI